MFIQEDRNFAIREGVLINYIGSNKNIIIPQNVIKISKNAFSRTSIETVTIPSSVKSLHDDAFASCLDLRDITIEGAESDVFLDELKLGLGCFKNCPSLKNIYLGRGLVLLEPNALRLPSELPFSATYSKDISISINADIVINKPVFVKCAGLRSIDFRNTHTRVGAFAISGCDNFNHIYNCEYCTFTPMSFESNSSICNVYMGCANEPQGAFRDDVVLFYSRAKDDAVDRRPNSVYNCTNELYDRLQTV